MINPILIIARAKDEEVAEASRTRDTANNALSQLESRLAMTRESIKDKSETMKGPVSPSISSVH